MTEFTVIEIPDLPKEYEEANRNFIIWFAPSVAAFIVACSLFSYVSTLEGDKVFLMWPVFLVSSATAIIAGAVLLTYMQRQKMIERKWDQHVEDRVAARDFSARSLELTFMVQVQGGNLNLGAQAFASAQPQMGQQNPRVTLGGRELKEFWSEHGGLPEPSKEPFVMDWADVDGLIDLLIQFGPSRRDVLAKPLPSGKAVYAAQWTAVTKGLAAVGHAVVIPRVPTVLKDVDAAKMKAALRARFPDGIQVSPTENWQKEGSGREPARNPVQNPGPARQSSGSVIDGTSYKIT